MTVTTTNTSVTYNGTGAQTSFPITFPFYEITVELLDSDFDVLAVWEQGTQYSLTGGGGEAGTLTVRTSPTNYTPSSSQKLRIKRTTARTQLTDYVANDPFPASAHEAALDRLAMVDQEIGATLDRFPENPTPNTILRANDTGTAYDQVLLSPGAVAIPIAVSDGGTGDTTAPGALTSLGVGLVSVAHYGASPAASGATNVTAFQEAIDATPNSGVQHIWVPPGTYAGDFSALSMGSRGNVILHHLGDVVYSDTAPSLSRMFDRYTSGQGPGPTYVGSLKIEKTTAQFAGTNLFRGQNLWVYREATDTTAATSTGFRVDVLSSGTFTGSTYGARIFVTKDTTDPGNDCIGLNVSTSVLDQSVGHLAIDVEARDETRKNSEFSPGFTCIESGCKASGLDNSNGGDGGRVVIKVACKGVDTSDGGDGNPYTFAYFSAGIKIKNQQIQGIGDPSQGAYFMKGIWIDTLKGSATVNDVPQEAGGIIDGIVIDDVTVYPAEHPFAGQGGNAIIINRPEIHGIFINTNSNPYSSANPVVGIKMRGPVPQTAHIDLECTTGQSRIRLGRRASSAQTLAAIEFLGNDNAGTPNYDIYADIRSMAVDITSGAEYGRISFRTLSAGSLSEEMTVGGTNSARGVCIGSGLEAQGVGTLNIGTALHKSGTKVVGARVTGWAAQTGGTLPSRDNLATSTDVPTIRDTLKTLINDLITHGLIGA